MPTEPLFSNESLTVTSSVLLRNSRSEVVGTSLRLFLNNTLEVTVNDSLLKSGSVGIRGSQTTYANFNASVLTAAAASLTFNDSFTTGNTLGQLANTWSTRNGDFTVSGGVANGQNPSSNLAVVSAIIAADVTVSADVNVQTGQQAGVVARYAGTGDDTMYLAVLDNTTGTPVVKIFRNSGNGFVQLGETALVQSNSGTLSLQVKGSALRLSFNGALLVDAIDLAPLGAGSVGIRGTQTMFDNFSAQ